VLAALRKELKTEEPAYSSPSAETLLTNAECTSPGRLMLRNAHRHAEIHELMAQGLTVSAIARRVRLDRKTVRRFASAEVAADLLGPRGRRATTLDPYLPYLATRWREGQQVAAFLFDEVWQQGYRGRKRTVRRQLAGWCVAEPPPPAHAMLPGPRTLAWLLLRRPSDLDEKEQVLLKQLYERSAELVSARSWRSTSYVWCVNDVAVSWMTGSPMCAPQVRRNYAASVATCSTIGMPSTRG
jgi:hypothetical protein